MAASLKVPKQSRSWKLKDSNDTEDLENLFGSDNVRYTKPVGCRKYWTLYLGLFVVFALFLFGIIVGFYLRADPKVSNECPKTERKDGFDKEKLQAIHNNIMYYMSGDRISKYNSDLLAISKPITDTDWEKGTAKYIEKEFRGFGFDHVSVEEHHVVITSPDPSKPNTLELLTLDGAGHRNTSHKDGAGKTLQKWSFTGKRQHQPVVAFSPEGSVKGPIHYANEGSITDFVQLHNNNITIQGSLVLLQLGRITPAEMVRNAEKFGAVGVLLFCNHNNTSYHGDCDTENTVVSAADFLANEEDQYPRIPIQTVSLEVARTILQKIQRTSQNNLPIDDVKIPADVRRDLSRLSAKLDVYNTRRTRTVYNVIGTIFGADEKDREIIVGAGSTVENQSTENTQFANLGTLMELAHSLNFIKKSQGWRPRRTIKLAYWGGRALSDVGLVKYIKNHKHILSDESVNYIDLDYTNQGQYLIETSSSLVHTVTKAARMVPDPGNPDISLADTWPNLSSDWYLTNQYPVNNYRKVSWYPMLQEVGVPTVVVRGVQYGGTNSSQSTSGEVTHHYRYHLATARVVSLVLLQLVDNERLPFNISFSVQCIVKSGNESIARLKQFVQFPKNKIEPVVASISRLSSLLISHNNNNNNNNISSGCMSTLQNRKYNDVVTKIDRIFMDMPPLHLYTDYLLRSDRETGTLSVLLDAVNINLLTKDKDPVYKILEMLSHSLEQLYTEIQSIFTQS